MQLLKTIPCHINLTKRLINHSNKCFLSSSQKLFSEKESDEDPNHPLRRTLNLLTRDFKSMRDFFRTSPNATESNDQKSNEKFSKDPDVPTEEFQTHCDVLIIGGGGIGSSISYWLKEKARNGLNVVVVEKDPTYRKSFAVQSYHGLHQNFTVPENIQVSMYGADFIRDIKKHLGNVNVNFTPYGSLRLACEENVDELKSISRLQNELGVRNELLTPEKIKAKFPWINTEGIVLGSHGLEKEGWFDPLALLFGYKNKALEYGAHFVDGEIIGFELQSQSNVLVDGEEAQGYQALDKAVVKMHDGEKRTIKFALCVIAGGSSSGKIARLARIGNATGLLSIPLPVEERKRNKYVFSSMGQEVPAFSTPLVIDPSGCYFTREGLSGNYLCGTNKSTLNEAKIQNSESGQDIFETEILPNLSQRVKAFSDAKVKKSWTETYEYNSFDENGIIGTHPYYNNLYIATGFNRHGIQQSPAVGRGISELIIDGRYRSIDLSRLGFDRFVVNQPLYEVSAI
ncbi:FAD-dependent oxidoreductase domain-containing protein 1 [Eupeodes corollae]|uniref:FAD-dependent oxidoreductase domain-containing protein 1 n=1 Tax=Eupeodes corollae TaxID=290404 RepID=UPI002492BBAB|nr:FAD-dependent oxidoreductase domain-containing protein 1 [Eupeodes corollae]